MKYISWLDVMQCLRILDLVHISKWYWMPTHRMNNPIPMLYEFIWWIKISIEFFGDKLKKTLTDEDTAEKWAQFVATVFTTVKTSIRISPYAIRRMSTAWFGQNVFKINLICIKRMNLLVIKIKINLIKFHEFLIN